MTTLILGAGLTGLSAAWHLERAGGDYLVLERNERVGGLARTETWDGFSFDHSIHILYTGDPYAAELITERLLPDRLVRQQRRSYCWSTAQGSRGVYTEYPYQANLYGLPPEVIAENIEGLVAAREAGDEPPPHFEAWIRRTFGDGIARHFMIPYNRRVWAWDLTDMNYGWIAERVPRPRLEDVLLGALQPPARKYGPNREFWYPAEGGIEALPRALADGVGGERLRLNASATAIDTARREVVLAGGERVAYDRLISTLPAPALVNLLWPTPPERVTAAAAGLKHNVVHTVDLGLEGDGLGVDRRMHWAYYASGPLFHRLSFPHAFSPWMVPAGCCSVQAEISSSIHRAVDRARLIDDTLAGLVEVGLLRAGEARPVDQGGRVRVAQVVTLDPAYIIYDHAHARSTQTLANWLATLDIQTRGRFGEWEYFNMDHSILSGRDAAAWASG